MASQIQIKQSVRELYMAHPFPQWTREERRQRFASELARYRYLGFAEAMRGGRFLDVGCGTGNRSMLIARHFSVREFVGLDHSPASLEIARRVAVEEGFEKFTPVEGDVFQIPYPEGSFDVVVSWGVLHHTSDPFEGLREMARVCRRGGLLGIFLYNRWNHWRHNLQKEKVSRLAGDDVEERFRTAHRLYGAKPLESMSRDEIVTFYDKYCHPHKSDHTLGETLSWFEKLGLSYWGSYLPLRLRDCLGFMQYRAALLAEYPTASGWNARLAKWVGRLPPLGDSSPPFRRPTILHRFLWQAIWAWRGRHGGYSEGASLSARKS